MRLDSTDLSDPRSLTYLERYVNDGSPSGFSELFTTSPNTSPFGDSETFTLLNFDIPSEFSVFRVGNKPPSLTDYDFLLHPDMAEHSFWSRLNHTIGPLVTPTSSARTVRLVGPDPVYFKLSYDQLIGRIPRQLTRKHAVSAIEVSAVITSALDENRLPPRFRFMREVYAEVINPAGTDEWGYVVRESAPYPHHSDEPYLIPAFSLFGRDRKAPDDPLLLDQLVTLSGIPPRTYVIDHLVQPLIEAHFALLKTCGLQLEPHAQNILFSFDSEYRPKAVVARDAESIDKDLGLISQLGLPLSFSELAYKCLRPSDYNYQIMHSFMFDFKMGEYLLDPLVHWLASRLGLDPCAIYSDIRRIVKDNLIGLPSDFLPLGCWYSYESIVHDRSKQREYTRSPELKFR